MPTYIIKLSDKDRDYYFDWSTIVDAPVSKPMVLDEYKEYYSNKYGTEGMRELPERLARCDKFGYSGYSQDWLKDILSNNKASGSGKHMTKKQLTEWCTFIYNEEN